MRHRGREPGDARHGKGPHPTAVYFYWSSTTWDGSEFDAWRVNFDQGFVFHDSKVSNDFAVRAVRGGL